MRIFPLNLFPFPSGTGFPSLRSGLLPMSPMMICARCFLFLMLTVSGQIYGKDWPVTNSHRIVPCQQEIEISYIFRNGEDGYACFRIPAIVLTKSGTLLAFAEGRKHGCSDTGDIDLVLKRSHDGGKTWGKLQVVWDDAENTCGNPSPVVDRETGRILLLLTWNLGSDHEKEIVNGTSSDTRRVFVTSSDDDGVSWIRPAEITKRVKRKDWTWYATGPGAGIQIMRSKYAGRLVIACDHLVAGTKEGFSHVIYSDNHGKTWKTGGISSIPQTNESAVAELSSGDLMLNMRNANRAVRHRQVAISHDGGRSWVEGRQDTTLVEPVCEASLMSHKFPGREKQYLLFSNPANPAKRVNLTIRVSDDDGRSWMGSRTIHQGPSAYSCLVSFPNGDAGILYEAGRQKPYEGIAFAVFTPEELLK